MRFIECCFYFEGDPDSEEAMIVPLCIQCYLEEKKGWPYAGPAGPWKYSCGKCSKVILDGIESSDADE